MIKRLIFFGCSMTMGHELADHELVDMDELELNRQKAKMSSMVKWHNDLLAKTKLTEEQYCDLCREKAWPKLLSDSLGLESINFAIPGGCIEYSYAQFLKIYELTGRQFLNPKTDLIVVGVSTQERFIHFERHDKMYSRVLSQVDSPERIFYEHYNDYKIMWNYYNTLWMFKKTCEEIGFKIIFLPIVKYERIDITLPIWHHYFSNTRFEDWDLMPAIKNKWQYIAKDFVSKHSLADTCLELYINNDEHLVWTGFKHPANLSNQIFAKQLKPIFEQKLKEIKCD